MDLKEKLADFGAAAQDKWIEFRARSGFFQARVALIAAYLGVVGLTVVIFPPPAPDIDVNVQRVEFGMSQRTKLLIRNLDLGVLENATVKVYGVGRGIDGKKTSSVWKTRRDHYFDENTPITLEGRDLSDAQGRVGPSDFTVDKVEVFHDGEKLATWLPDR